mgnify:CR=1 FL=1
MEYKATIEEENKEIAKRYKNLLKETYQTLSRSDKLLIRKAFNLSVEAHSNQRRKTGEPYIFHPISVAKIVANEIGLGAVSIVAALLHDVVITVGFMSLFNIEFNLTMIAALLLIAGYSINDTIVLFDRLRSLTSDENNKDSFSNNVNNSIQLNLRRTILTSFTTILALICLVLLAPVNLTEMPIVFIFGVLIGTYSSLFLALSIVGDLNYEAVLKARDS